MQKTIYPKPHVHGVLSVPGDKSISHRAVMFGAIAQGETKIHGFLKGEDCLATIRCFEELGVPIQLAEDVVTIHGQGLHGLKPPMHTLNVGNSGTTLRLLCGLLSGQPFCCTITGDASIQKRPMDRVISPLRLMGAKISGQTERLFAPLTISGQPLHGIQYTLPVASAQVKSAILLAGLYAQGETRVIEPVITRDHTELMLNSLGASIKRDGDTIVCRPVEELYGKTILIPGDISSAAYFIVAALIRPDSAITLTNVGVNETRTGVLSALKRMGATLRVEANTIGTQEKTASITASSSALTGITISGREIPLLIDEIPILAVAACYAEGTTIIKDAQELKVKESNRIHTTVTELTKMGAHIKETDDGMVIVGGHPLHGATVESHYDHRIAMSLAIAALGATEEIMIENAQCVDISFPGFYDYIAGL